MNEHDEHEGQAPPEEGMPVERPPAEVEHAPASALALLDAYKKASTQDFSPEEVAVLIAPIDEETEVELHPIDGPYVHWRAYTGRMNRAFGWGKWSLVRQGPPDIDADNKTVAIRACLLVKGAYIRDAVGEFTHRGSKKMTMYDCLEAAMKNALKRCCSGWNMFPEVRDRRWRDAWLAKWARRVKKEDGHEMWEYRSLPVQASAPPPPAKKATPSMRNVTKGFVRKAERTTESGTYLLTIETKKGEVQLKGNSSLQKYPDKSQLVNLLVEFTAKEVPQRGGGTITVLDTLEIKEEPA